MRAGVVAVLAFLAVALAQRARAAMPENTRPDNSFMGPPLDDYTGAFPMTDAEALTTPTVQAFLRMIRVLEHSETAEADHSTYNTFFGGTWFSNLTNHPVATGEKKGVPLPPAMCVAAGYPGGQCVSTAAGAYQFTLPTWREVAARGPLLPDFSPSSQDLAAVRLLRQLGALEPLAMGDLETALRRASTRWASLPYSTAQQRPKPLAVALQVFNEGLV